LIDSVNPSIDKFIRSTELISSEPNAHPPRRESMRTDFTKELDKYQCLLAARV